MLVLHFLECSKKRFWCWVEALGANEVGIVVGDVDRKLITYKDGMLT